MRIKTTRYQNIQISEVQSVKIANVEKFCSNKGLPLLVYRKKEESFPSICCQQFQKNLFAEKGHFLYIHLVTGKPEHGFNFDKPYIYILYDKLYNICVCIYMHLQHYIFINHMYIHLWH